MKLYRITRSRYRSRIVADDSMSHGLRWDSHAKAYRFTIQIAGAAHVYRLELDAGEAHRLRDSIIEHLESQTLTLIPRSNP